MLDGISVSSPHGRRLSWTRRLLLALLFTLILPGQPSRLHAVGEEQVLQMIGPGDALILAGPDHRTLLQKNIHTPLIPASTLKLLSALAVMDTLGRDHRFEPTFMPEQMVLSGSRGLVTPCLFPK